MRTARRREWMRGDRCHGGAGGRLEGGRSWGAGIETGPWSSRCDYYAIVCLEIDD